MKHRAIVALFATLISIPSVTFADELIRYSAAGNPKAKGLDLVVKYPSGWLAKDGERPNIVQKFVKSGQGMTELMMLQVNNMPPEAAREVAKFNERDIKDIFASIGENTIVNSVKRTKVDNQPAYMADMTYTVEGAGMKIYQSTAGVIMFYRDKMIMLTCGVGGLPQQMSLIDSKQQTNRRTVCQLFFNSLVILDQYK